MHWLQWAVLPFYGYIVLRSFISALERPRWALVIVVIAVAFNAFANWCLIFGNLGFPADGHCRLRPRHDAVQHPDVRRPGGLSSRSSDASAATACSAASGAPTGRASAALLRLGLPIAGILTFEVTIFNAAALLMGLIDAASLAAHAIAIQIASITFMVPMGLSQAVHGARRPRLRRRRPGRHHAAPAGRAYALGVSLHGADGADHGAVAATC